MSTPIEFNATVAAWASKQEYNIRGLSAAIDANDAGAVVDAVVFYGAPDREKFGDYVRIGEADITIRLIPHDERVQLAVEALRKELDKARAEWLQRQSDILAQINRLQAIEYTPESA